LPCEALGPFLAVVIRHVVDSNPAQ
jgi:hypothetical protein